MVVGTLKEILSNYSDDRNVTIIIEKWSCSTWDKIGGIEEVDEIGDFEVVEKGNAVKLIVTTII